jgi:hypothetical protein
MAQFDRQGRLYFSTFQRKGIRRLDREQDEIQLVIGDLRAEDWSNWRIRKDKVYWVNRKSEREVFLDCLDIETGDSRRLVVLPSASPAHIPSLAVDARGERFLLARIDRAESDILAWREDRNSSNRPEQGGQGADPVKAPPGVGAL